MRCPIMIWLFLLLPLLPDSRGIGVNELRAAESQRASASTSRLRVLQPHYPQAFFFRAAEGFARRTNVSYEDWEATFSRLMGIEGKVLDEEVPGTAARNIAFFARFKDSHPDQLVLLHYNGNARDPRYETEGYFAGHWLYYEGQKLLIDLPAEEGIVELPVEKPHYFRTNIGRYRTSNDDVGICELDEQGRPNWHRAEQVQLVSADAEAGTIRLRRGCYGTSPRAFRAGRAYLAVHVNEGPWGRRSNLLWHYNYTTCCPEDLQGRTCGEVHAEELAARFAPGGELALFDGLEFDVLAHSKSHLRPRGSYPGVDCDGDGAADAGVFEGVDEYARGVLQFLTDLRERMGENRLILADGHGPHHQRGFGILNGIESEGWPTLSDCRMEDWPGGMNRHAFWAACGRTPVFNYINHKYIVPGDEPGETRHPDYPAGIDRLVFAAAVFTDAAVCYSMSPRPEPGEAFGIWDELRMGTENRLGWLGKPLSPTVRMAEQTPDRLDGKFAPPTSAILGRLVGEQVRGEIVGDRLRLSPRKAEADGFEFRLADVPCSAGDLFVAMTATAEPLTPYPDTMARLAHVGFETARALTDRFEDVESGMQRRGEGLRPVDTASGAQVSYAGPVTLGTRRCQAVRVHPPYRDGKTGLVFWQRDVDVRPGAVLTFCTGMGEKAPGRSDGVVFRVEAVPLGDPAAGTTRLFEHRQVASEWIPHRVRLDAYAGRSIRLRFVADAGPEDHATTDHGMWGDVYVAIDRGDGPLPAPRSERFMAWVGSQPFTSYFAFQDVEGKTVDLTFRFEGNAPVYLSRITAHAATDVTYREFEHGLVIANPSPREPTVDLATRFPGASFRRLRGSPHQDPGTNNGQTVGDRLQLPARDALFLVRVEGRGES